MTIDYDTRDGEGNDYIKKLSLKNINNTNCGARMDEK